MNRRLFTRSHAMKLGSKTTLIIALVQIPLLLIAAMISIQQSRNDVINTVSWRALALSEPLQNRAASLAGYAPKMQRTLGLNIDCQTLMEGTQDPDLIQVGIIGTNKEVIAHTDAQRIGTFFSLEMSETQRTPSTVQTSLNAHAFDTLLPFRAHPDSPVIGFVQMSFSRDSIDKKVQHTILYFSVFFMIFLIISFLLISGLLRKVLTHPIAELCQAASALASGQSAGKVTVTGAAEIRLLANSFNHMHDEILQQFTELNHAIGKRKQVEEEQSRTNENLRITLNSIGDAVIATDEKGHITRMNPIAEKLTGWPHREAKGLPLTEVFKIINIDTREPAANPVDQVLATGQMVGLAPHTALVSKDGVKRLISDSGAPIRDRENTIIGVVLVFRDISEESAMQERLRQSQKMEAIGQLAGGVAHDFNNMLGGIMGAAELLGLELPDSPTARKYHGIILESAKRAKDLTSKLLAFGRKQQTASTAIDLHEIIREATSIMTSSTDRLFSFKLTLEATTHTIIGDPSQLQNAIMNLAINSTHAMPHGGLITITTQNMSLNDEDCSNSPYDITPGPYIEVAVHDHGTGISPEHLSRIFEPFFSTKGQGKGTGLGLAAVYGTVQQHHGGITVTSRVGVGTIFHILLPLTNQVIPPPSPQSELAHGSGTILVVDDEPAMRTMAAAMLENLGYSVETAENGASGLQHFKDNPRKYNLVVLDMMMPVMSGKECFIEMLNIDPNVRVILASGFAKEGDLQDMKARGLRGFISKPFLMSELSQLVLEALTNG